ncbi:DHBP synthase RibB-like alpha/beta domain [Forsythia ovata]|uniref:DHBP synthase RibB-like alpha/beta domain n=1 Tax=Forsythia ovata TaxID=205694 RepID=A0ABD1UVU8_9LAMI
MPGQRGHSKYSQEPPCQPALVINAKPLSILCRSFKDIDTYTTGFPRGNGQGLTNIFQAVKNCLPGPSPKENEWILDPVIIADVYGPEELEAIENLDSAAALNADNAAENSRWRRGGDGVVGGRGGGRWLGLRLDPGVVIGDGPKQPWMIAEDEDSSVKDYNLLIPRAS